MSAVEATCHCGLVKLEIAAAPAQVTDCNCTVCGRYGVLWAYYKRSDVVLPAEELTHTYARGPKTIAFHRCRDCGCVTHWFPIGREADRLGVNARLMPPAVLAAARVRRLDGLCTEEYID